MPKNEQERILQSINFVEESFPVKDWEAAGTKIWPLLRLNLGLELFFNISKEGEGNQVSKNRKISVRLVKMCLTIYKSVKNIIADFRSNESSNKKSDVTFLVASSTRFFKIDERWYNPYYDSFIPFLEKVKKQTNCLEYSSDHQFKVPRFRASALIQLNLYWCFLIAFVKSRLHPLKLYQLEGFEDFRQYIETNLGSFGYFKYKVLDLRVYVFCEYKKYFIKKLKNSQTKLTLNDGYYSLEGMSFIAASKALNIPSIELQHGVQGPGHVAYRKWLNTPDNGYEVFPNFFWTWGRSEAEYLNSWLGQIDGSVAIVGGNPCLNIYKKDGENIGETYNARIKSLISERGNVNILFTAQAFFELPTFFLESVQSNKNWTFWIRIHPQYLDVKESLKKQLSQISNTNIIIEEASDFPLASLLNFMDLHITEFSSCVLEAAVLGIKSIVVNNRAEAIYADLIENQTVYTAYDKNALDAVIYSILGNRGLELSTNQEEVFSQGLNFLREQLN